MDSVWTQDVTLRINHVIAYKTDFLPKYKLLRKSIRMPEELSQLIKELKKIYDSVLDVKSAKFEKDMDKNQLFVQPKAYISSLLSLKIFDYYPDVYAVLLNPVHLELRPKTSKQELERYTSMFERAFQSISPTLGEQLSKITMQMSEEEKKFNEQGISRQFQGMVTDEYRNKCKIVSFLMWTE